MTGPELQDLFAVFAPENWDAFRSGLEDLGASIGRESPQQSDSAAEESWLKSSEAKEA